MIDADKWMRELTVKLKSRFGDKLCFAGLQGSYQRGEQHKDSDIDAVVILDTLSFDDLAAYKEIILTMPENDKACGFISGKQELMNWPKHELFQFSYDTRSFYGSLHELLPNIEDKDVADSVKISASGIYHLCCHTAVHEPSNTIIIESLYKGAFFILQALHYLRSGDYISTKKELSAKLHDDEKTILDVSMHLHRYQNRSQMKYSATHFRILDLQKPE